jgi:hypothetical protein
MKIEEPAKVLFHLNEGFTKIILERTIEVGLAEGSITWEIPTEKIPHHLRKIGSRFLISGDTDNFDKMIFSEL